MLGASRLECSNSFSRDTERFSGVGDFLLRKRRLVESRPREIKTSRSEKEESSEMPISYSLGWHLELEKHIYL